MISSPRLAPYFMSYCTTAHAMGITLQVDVTRTANPVSFTATMIL